MCQAQDKMFQILEGSAYDLIPKIPDASVDCVFTSPEPPFNSYEMDSLIRILLRLYNKVKPTGSIWIELPDYHNIEGSMALIPERFLTAMVADYGWICRSKLIWHRPDYDKLEDPTRFKRDYEMLYWFVKMCPGYYYNEANDLDINTSVHTFNYNPPKPNTFESGFPIELISMVLDVSCPPAGVVLDPFCGTGSTGIAALNYNMNFIGFEQKADLIPKINQRLTECLTLS